MASDPLLAQQMLDDQTAQVEGAAAARELEALATDLEARGQQLQAIEAADRADGQAKSHGRQQTTDEPSASRKPNWTSRP